MFSGEWSHLEVFEGAVDGFPFYQSSKRTLGVVDPRPDSPQPITGVIKKWAGSDDVVTCLEGGWVVGCMPAGAEEE